MKTRWILLLPIICATVLPAAMADDRLNVAECFARLPL